jgi:protein transport protein SEC31
MSRLNEIYRTAVSAWSPCPGYSNYLAVGSISGTIDFSSEAKLEIIKGVDLKRTADTTTEGALGSVVSADRFNRLAWGQPGETFEMGVVAGAMLDGNITLWDPKKIIAAEENSVIATLDKHTAGVRGLEFNPTQHNLLASAGEDSILYIWNLKNPSAPTPITLSGKNPHHDQTISHLSWNRIFEYILATTSYNGTSVVWDLKQKKPIVPIVSAQKRRYSSLAWNPEEPTQLVFACEDDNSPVIELWDLKKAYQPIKELHGHQRGILSVSWCPDDSNLLVSCGKDGRTIIWNPNSGEKGEILGELPTHSTNWMYDVQWSRRPSILSAASLDGRIGVYSLQDSSADDTTQSFGQEFIKTQPQQTKQSVFKTAPKWLQRPCGATFGFGGRIVTFNNSNKQSRTVTVHAVASDTEFGKRSLALENALGSGSLELIQQYCQSKADENSQDEVEKNTWNIMSVLFERERTQKLLSQLGLEASAISRETQQKLADEEGESESQEHEPSSVKLSTTQVDELIRRSVMVQNYEDAVNVCLKAGRLADALIIATFGGGDLYSRTRAEYFSRQTRPIMRTVSNILNQRFDEVIQNSDLSQWKETLAEICSCPKPDQFAHHCQQLGTRLETEANDVSSALICYMLAGDVQKTISIWLQQYLAAEQSHSEDEDPELLKREHKHHLVQFIEKVAVFQATSSSATDDQLKLIQQRPELVQIYTEYATKLSTQGQQLLPLSLFYLNLVTSGQQNVSADVYALRHRVYNAVARPTGPKPELPWVLREPKAVAPQTTTTANQQKVSQPTRPSFGQPTLQSNFGFSQPQPQPMQSTNQPILGTNQPPLNPNQQTLQPNFGFTQPQPQPMQSINQPPLTQPFNPPTSGFGQLPSQPYQPGSHIGLPPQPVTGGFNEPSPLLHNPSIIPPPTGGGFTQPPSFHPVNPTTPTTEHVPQEVSPPVVRKVTEVRPVRSTTTTTTSGESEKLISVDLSSIKPEYVPVIEQLTIAYEHAFREDAPSYHKSKKRMVCNNLNELFRSIQEGRISDKLGEDMIKVATIINDPQQYSQVEALLRDISTQHWKEAKPIVQGLKFLLTALKA